MAMEFIHTDFEMTIDQSTEELPVALDETYLINTLAELARVPTEVPLGPNTFMEPDDPKLVHYVQRELRPRIQSLGKFDVADVPRNQLLVRIGEGTSPASMLVMVYTPTQHHNLMDDPFSGKIDTAAQWGFDEPCVFGQGVTQNKAHHAVMLSLLKMIAENHISLKGTLYFGVNNEGRSSHDCSRAILDTIDRLPDFGVILIGTGLRVSLGNRGRVDVNVEVRGKASHSSAPGAGLSAIDGANEVLNRLKQMRFEGTHPILVGRHVLAYQISYEPVAPHTLPEVAHIKVDRRLLPGDDPELATGEVRDAIGDMSPYEITVDMGPYMLPALVDPDHFGVLALVHEHREVVGENPETIYGQGTYDAGGPCSAGVPIRRWQWSTFLTVKADERTCSFPIAGC